MPYKIERRDSRFCVIAEDTGKQVGCHDTEEKAKAQIRALYASVPDAKKSLDGVEIAFGGALKALDDSGRIEGPLVVFGSESATDLSRFRDFFTVETDFGRGLKAGVDLLYNHGLPNVGPQPNALADRTLGEAELSVKSDDPASVWMTGQLNLRDDYEKKVLDAVKAGKMALSSGTATHLIRRQKQGNGAHKVLRWPLVEASITPIPADPRTWVSGATKSLDEWAVETKCGPYYDSPGPMDPGRAASMAVIDRLTSMLTMMAYKELGDREKPVDDRLAAIRSHFDSHRDLILRAVRALLESPDADEAMADSKSLWIGAHRQALSHLRLTDHIDAVHDAAKSLVDRLTDWAAHREAKGQPIQSNRVDGIKTLRATLDALVAAALPKPDHSPDDLIQRYLDVEARLYGAGYHA